MTLDPRASLSFQGRTDPRLDLHLAQGGGPLDSGWGWMRAYRISKLAVVLFTTELTRRVDGSGVTVMAISPDPTKTNLGGGGPSRLMGVVTPVLKHQPLGALHMHRNRLT